MTDDGDEGKRDGMARADEHANEDWKRVADISIREVARRRPYFTTDHVWSWLRENYPNHTTREHRAMGPRMSAAAHAEACLRINDYSPSAMEICHSRFKQVWASLIYRGPGPRYRTTNKPFDKRNFGESE